MNSSAFSFLGSIFNRGKNKENKREIETEKKWKKLVKSDFQEGLLHDFAGSVLAQEIPDDAFSVLISEGNRDVASYFFEVDPSRGDALSAGKIRAILDTQDLMFVNKERPNAIDEVEFKALKLLTGYAAIEAAGLLQLLISPRCAMIALALWRNSLLHDVVLMQLVATVGGYQSYDLKKYCQSPSTYKIDEFSTLTATDLFLIDTIRKNPTRVFDILFLQEVA